MMGGGLMSEMCTVTTPAMPAHAPTPQAPSLESLAKYLIAMPTAPPTLPAARASATQAAEGRGEVSAGSRSKHYTRAHAVCSSSASHMWRNCPPSARLNELFPDEPTVYALEGTFVHELCEYKLKRHLKKRVKRPQSENFDSEQAERNSDLYAETVIEAEQELIREHGSCIMLIEERLDFSHIVPDGFGSGDCVLCSPGAVHVFDYKNGRVFVDADHNSQMMLYAAAAVNAYDWVYDFQTVSMTIVQPNVDNISTFSCTKAELLEWAETIKPAALEAYEGRGEQRCGDWCRWCRAKPLCKARYDEALALVNSEFVDLDASPAPPTVPAVGAEMTEDVTFKPPALVSKTALEDILPTLNRISDWIESVFSYVSSEAIHHGVSWRGYKVVEGRSRRAFTDTDAVVKAAAEAGYTDIWKTEMISLSEFEKMMGKREFARILGGYVVKPPGKLSLVDDSDPRPAVDLSAAAAAGGEEFAVLDNAEAGD